MKRAWVLWLVMALTSCGMAQTRVIDTPFKVASTLSLASAFADAEVSHRYANTATCEEINPVFGGGNITRARYYQVTLGTWAAVTVGSFFAKKRGHKWWYYLQAGESAVHVGGVEMTLVNCR